MNSLYKSFLSFIVDNHLFHAKDRLLVAVSGGIDSVVLCELCHHAGYAFAIAHCNFQLRGKESDEDESFVRALAEKYGVKLFVKRFGTRQYAEGNKLSIQVAARELRYHWFGELLANMNESAKPGETKAPFRGSGAILLTAHHADDNIETILMNFFKGSGINGLKGMLPKHGKIVRPLLFAHKKELTAFATEKELPWREDSSNSTDHYTRNYFRNQLIPGLQKVFPQVEENLAHNAERFRDINTIYDIAVKQIKKKLITQKEDEMHVPVLKLLKKPSLHTILYEIIKEAGFSSQQVPEVLKLLKSESGRSVLSATHRVLRNRQWLIISPLNEGIPSIIVIAENDQSIKFPGGEIHIERKEEVGNISPDAHIALLDARDIRFPLLLRRWRAGDYFYPLGMPKKKKLSRFFIDCKMSLLEKEKTWLIESNKKIVWIVGKRIDDRFKIYPGTTKVLQLRLRPAE